MSAVFVDLPALAQILQQVPLLQRLHLEEELLQVGWVTDTNAKIVLVYDYSLLTI